MVRKINDDDVVESKTPDYFDDEEQRLAPQEVYRPDRRPVQARSEMTKTDRNRLRRKLKQVRKSQAQQREERQKILARLNPHKQASLEKHQALKSLSRQRNVTIATSKSNHKITKSHNSRTKDRNKRQ